MAECTIPTCHRTLTRDEAHRTACRRCTHRIRAWLREIPLQQPLLRASLHPDRPTPGPTQPRGRATAPLPAREDVLSLTGPAPPADRVYDPYGQAAADQHGPLALHDTLAHWIRLIMQQRRARGPTRPHTPDALTTWLSNHLDWAACQPWISELHRELGELIRRIRAITRTHPQRRTLGVPCPRCNNIALMEEDWQTYIDCEACGTLLTRNEYDAHAATLYRLALHLLPTHPTDPSGTA